MKRGGPQTQDASEVAEALFNPDQSVFVTTRWVENEPPGKPKSLGPEDIEDARDAHAKIARGRRHRALGREPIRRDVAAR